MKLKKLHTTLLLTGIAVCNFASAQLFIDNAQFFIQPGATVTVQGNVTSNTDILGTGLLQMTNPTNTAQSINMNGFNIPNLEIANTGNVTLTGAAKLSGILTLTNGKLQLGANNFTLANTATFAGTPGNTRFIETNGTGQVIKLLTANVSLSQIPLGAGSLYRPAFITSTGTYANASVGVRVVGAADPNMPPKISDHVDAYWPVTKTGVTGTVTVAGQYTAVTGTEANLRGYYYNGTDWASTGEAHDATLNRVTAPITTASGEVYGMDKFVLSRTKVFLQGAYNSSTGLMTDALRTAPSLIPLSDPYRTAPYTNNFTHVANTVAETATAAIFADQASINDNIVDWVFIELRNTASPGNTVLQTRSAFVKRNGDIVDIDGKSPVTFNNTANGNYTIAVRHRNHLGISADPLANAKALAEAKSTATALDLTTATDAQVFGAAGAAYNVVSGKNVMWCGNANFNTNVRYGGLANDKDYLYVTTLGNNPLGVLTNVYNSADMNMNRIVRYGGLNNDKDVLYVNALGNSPIAVRTQALPN